MKIDPSTTAPQIVFTYYWSGGHCCTVTKIATLDSGGNWHVVDGGVLDGGGFEFKDLDGDGGRELVSLDNSFLYAFGCYACSYAPTRIKKLIGTDLRDVTVDGRYQSFLRLRLREMQANARTYGDEQTFHSGGYLGGWVAAKALVGEFPDAWRKMLTSYHRSSDWTMEECIRPIPLNQCSEAERRQVDFPEALAAHLMVHGYITAEEKRKLNLVQAAAPAPNEQQQPARNPPSPDTNDPRTRASSFVLELLRIWSEPNDPALSTKLNAFYADQVSYYGKLTTRQAVLDDKTRFATRWPDRKYQLRPGSLVANCEQVSSTCNVDGVVDWQARSPARGASSSGSARFSYALTAAGPSFIVISENSSVLRREPTSPTLVVDPPTEAKAAPAAAHAALSQGELDALRAKLISLWNPPAAVSGHPDQYIVTIRIRLARDHRLAGQPEVLTSGAGPLFEATRDSAVRAVVQAQPYDMLSPSSFEAWKEIDINFDPREVVKPVRNSQTDNARCETIADKKLRTLCFEQSGVPVIDCNAPRDADEAAFCRQTMGDRGVQR